MCVFKLRERILWLWENLWSWWQLAQSNTVSRCQLYMDVFILCSDQSSIIRVLAMQIYCFLCLTLAALYSLAWLVTKCSLPRLFLIVIFVPVEFHLPKPWSSKTLIIQTGQLSYVLQYSTHALQNAVKKCTKSMVMTVYYLDKNESSKYLQVGLWQKCLDYWDATVFTSTGVSALFLSSSDYTFLV